MKVASLRGCIEAGVFNKLTVFNAVGCVFDSAFLVYLCGPCSAIRQQLRVLRIDLPCADSTSFDTTRNLAYTFSLFQLLPTYTLVALDSDSHLAFTRAFQQEPWATHPVEAHDVFHELQSVPKPFRTRHRHDYDYFTERLVGTVSPFPLGGERELYLPSSPCRPSFQQSEHFHISPLAGRRRRSPRLFPHRPLSSLEAFHPQGAVCGALDHRRTGYGEPPHPLSSFCHVRVRFPPLCHSVIYLIA